jgi:hypothetical protein
MAKPADPQMLTANRLADGDVLYWKAGTWVLALKDADVFADAKEADAALASAQKYVADNVVVNPYLFDVKTDAKGIHPVKEREIIRAAGPTVRHDLGKQATLASQDREKPEVRIQKSDGLRQQEPPYEI